MAKLLFENRVEKYWSSTETSAFCSSKAHELRGRVRSPVLIFSKTQGSPTGLNFAVFGLYVSCPAIAGG